METWKEIESKGVRLLVGTLGTIKRPAHTTTYTRTRSGKDQHFTAFFPEKVVTSYQNKRGYLEVAILENGHRAKHPVHRLVGFAYVDGYEDGLTINHINGVKTDNRAANLEWVSLARNSQHQWEAGLVDLRGENQPNHKLKSKQVVYIRRLLLQGVSAHTLAVIAGVSQSLIAKIRDGKAWSLA